MDLTLHLKSALMGVIEGLTEFLPVSSTGHLILARHVIRFDIETAVAYMVIIQSAALLAVCWEYRARLLRLALGVLHRGADRKLAINILVGFFPAALAGLALAGIIETFLFSPYVVAGMFFLGGVVILFIERLLRTGKIVTRVHDIDAIDLPTALKIGLIQCLALIPGTSRSGATIVGGVAVGLSRTAATEFSFFLAIPMITGASAYEFWKLRDILPATTEWPLYITGGISAFVSAFLCVRWLLKYIGDHDFRVFAWYRMLFGVVVLGTAVFGWVDWS